MDDENDALVLDIGTGALKAGFCSEDAPKHLIPMVLGKPKNAGVLVGMDQKDWYIGEEAQEKAQHLILRHPVEKGRIKDSEAIEDINNILQNLMTHDMLIDPESYKFMVTETPNNPAPIREEFVTLMFEELKVPGLYMGNQAVMSLFATGRTTGTVLDAGEGVTHAVPIYEGYAIPHFITEIPICGKDLTKYMVHLLKRDFPEYVSDDTQEKEDEAYDVAMKIKHLHGQVAHDYDAELKMSNDANTVPKKYKLPGSQTITVNKQCLECPEILFAPNQNQTADDASLDGIHQHTYATIIKCDRDIQKPLFNNIVLAGGCTMFKGMKERMQKEVQALAPSNFQPEVDSPADRKHSAWLGGAILSSMSRFDSMFIKKSEYDEEGSARIVHRKCF